MPEAGSTGLPDTNFVILLRCRPALNVRGRQCQWNGATATMVMTQIASSAKGLSAPGNVMQVLVQEI